MSVLVYLREPSVAAQFNHIVQKDKCENQLSDTSCPQIFQDSVWFGINEPKC